MLRLLCLLAAFALCAPSARAGPPETGDRAPDFSLVGSDGQTHALASHLGMRGVVLAWFPKAFTGG